MYVPDGYLVISYHVPVVRQNKTRFFTVPIFSYPVLNFYLIAQLKAINYFANSCV